MHIFNVIMRMHILDVLLLLLLPTMVIAPLFWECQPQSNNAAGSVVVPKTTVLSSTRVLKHKYVESMLSQDPTKDNLRELNNPSYYA